MLDLQIINTSTYNTSSNVYINSTGSINNKNNLV